jgi:hypothetical protein
VVVALATLQKLAIVPAWQLAPKPKVARPDITAHSVRSLLILPASYSIHPSTWKVKSANFALTEFSEVQLWAQNT